MVFLWVAYILFLDSFFTYYNHFLKWLLCCSSNFCMEEWFCWHNLISLGHGAFIDFIKIWFLIVLIFKNNHWFLKLNTKLLSSKCLNLKDKGEWNGHLLKLVLSKVWEVQRISNKTIYKALNSENVMQMLHCSGKVIFSASVWLVTSSRFLERWLTF